MPVSGNVETNNYQYASSFRHMNETARAGYYSVYLEKPKVKAEFTVTRRAGFHKYTFEYGKKAGVVIDLKHRDEVIESWIEVISNTQIQGMRRSKAWAENQTVYFYIIFQKPFDSYGITTDDKLCNGINKAEGKNIKLLVNYKNIKQEPLLIKIGISAVSTDGAYINLLQEIRSWNFEEVSEKAKQEWNKELSKIIVEGGTYEDRVNFYTALYHCMLSPNLYCDVDGQYRGRDNRIHLAKDFEYYTVFSLWDTYRAEHPLFTIIDQRRTVYFIKTYLEQYQQAGLLPVWELSANETNCMIGYHAVPVIADAFVKNIRNFDLSLAFQAMKNSSLQDYYGLKYYRQFGHIPGDLEPESVSKTLEYAYDDWCISQVAKFLGRTDGYLEYIKRAQYYKNVFDPSTGFMRAKWNGGWYKPFNPSEVNNNYTEANAWQYSFYVPQDINGMITLFGGKEKFAEKIDELFSTEQNLSGRPQADITGLIGQYAHGNEPSHHIAYLYDYAGQPWKTQQKVHQILADMYNANPDGLCGNEDCGQMSAWYVLSAMGFYPVCPGQLQYALGSPLFKKITVNLENNKKFIINAENISPGNFYIRSGSLNGHKYSKCYINHNDITSGGELVFIMDNEPEKTFGSKDDDIPKTGISDNLILPVPVITSDSRIFRNRTEVVISEWTPDIKIFYTLDNTEPDTSSSIYKIPLVIISNTTVKAVAYSDDLGYSFTVKSEFFKLPEGRTIKLLTQPDPQYSAGGAEILMDGISGNKNWRLGGWLGYWGKDAEVIIDLGSPQKINQISSDFLQDSKSWIMMPCEVVILTSDDGSNFRIIATVKNDVPQNTEEILIKEFKLKQEISTRYIKITGRNQGKLPQWHISAGKDSWTFIDEITIE
jgi:predicted alpha-1,2-mannosidase